MGGTNDYVFQTRWLVPGSVEELSAVLSDPEQLPNWWPAVYREVRKVSDGDSDGVGAAFDLFTNGWLPYTLRWRLTVLEHHKDGSAFSVAGDLTGRGEWTYEQHDDHVIVVFDWVVRADRPMLRHGSVLFKPVLAANHNWAMRMGERSLLMELDRRRRLPASAPPAAPRWPLIGRLSVIALVAVALRRLRRQH